MKRREMSDLLSSKLKVAGSNPAGVATFNSCTCILKDLLAAGL